MKRASATASVVSKNLNRLLASVINGLVLVHDGKMSIEIVLREFEPISSANEKKPASIKAK
jgi:hypothetical protein